MWDPNQDMNDTGQLKERLTRFSSSAPLPLLSLEDLERQRTIFGIFYSKMASK